MRSPSQLPINFSLAARGALKVRIVKVEPLLLPWLATTAAIFPPSNDMAVGGCLSLASGIHSDAYAASVVEDHLKATAKLRPLGR